MTSLTTAIIKTLCYADVFDYPLTRQEIYRFLIAEKPHSQYQVDQTLEKLAAVKKIVPKGEYFYLPQRSKLISLRQKRLHVSQAKISLAKRITRPISYIPGVNAIFLTGALAMQNADATDDIDILLVTKAGRLWITRLLVTLVLNQQGIRRKPPGKSVGNNSSLKNITGRYQDLICPNMYLDLNTLKIPESKQNIYTAHETIQVKPLHDPHGIHHQFLAANSWVSKYLPHALPKNLAHIHNDSKPTPLIARIIEHGAYFGQRLYMTRRRTRETITRSSAYFHPRDTGKQVLIAYEAKLAVHLR
jgi:hypothetical protein